MAGTGPPGGSVARTLAEGIAIVLVVFPPHFFSERPRATIVSTALILLLFFLPPLWALRRLGPLEGTAPRQALGLLGLGFLLGLGAGLAGGLEKFVLMRITGESSPVALPLWMTLALAFALASGLAYAAIMFLGRSIALVARSRDGAELLELLRVTPDRRRARAILLSVVPGLGHYVLGDVRRGRRYLLVTLACALAGLLVVVAALILLVEAALPTLWILVGGLVLLLLPGVLAVVAALDAALVGSTARSSS